MYNDLREHKKHGDSSFPVAVYPVYNKKSQQIIIPHHWHNEFEWIYMDLGEAIFTIDQKDYEKIIPVEDVNIIGYIQKPELGSVLMGRNGEEIALKAQGFDAFPEGN